MTELAVREELLLVDGRRTRIKVEGDPENPPVLLLHGIGRSLEDWDEIAPRLAVDHYVIRLDVAGFGFSDPMPGRVTHHALGQCIEPVLSELGEHRALHVVGNSLGGSTAMEFAAVHPDRVRSLTLLNSAGFGRETTALLRLIAIPALGWLATRRTLSRAAYVTERAIYADRALVTRDRVDLAVRLGNHPGNRDFMHAMVRHVGTWRGARTGWRARLLGDVTRYEGPVLVVWGDRDRILPAAHMQQALRTFPSARSHLFRGVGHMPQVEVPEETERLLRDFWATVD